MATRRRRPTATTTDSVLAKIPDGAWEDFGAEAPELSKIPDGAWEDFGAEKPEPTHEEMLEIAEEREAEQELDESASVEAFLAAAAADTFEALQASEEAKGLDGFFEPESHKLETPVHLPAVTVPAKKKVIPNHNHQRVITRSRKS